MWIYIVDMHFHILADVFFFDNMNYSSKLFNPTSFVIEPYFSVLFYRFQLLEFGFAKIGSDVMIHR